MDVVSKQRSLRKLALQGGKAKYIVGISLQDELDQPITQAAHAVVQKDWVGPIRGHSALNLSLPPRGGASQPLQSVSAGPRVNGRVAGRDCAQTRRSDARHIFV